MSTFAAMHSVSNDDAWKAVFEKHGAVRRGNGATGHRILRDGNDVLVIAERLLVSLTREGRRTVDSFRPEVVALKTALMAG